MRHIWTIERSILPYHTRFLDEISTLGDISTGILLDENDTLLKIDANYYDVNNPSYAGFGDPGYGDTQILICAYKLRTLDSTVLVFWLYCKCIVWLFIAIAQFFLSSLRAHDSQPTMNCHPLRRVSLN